MLIYCTEVLLLDNCNFLFFFLNPEDEFEEEFSSNNSTFVLTGLVDTGEEIASIDELCTKGLLRRLEMAWGLVVSMVLVMFSLGVRGSFLRTPKLRESFLATGVLSFGTGVGCFFSGDCSRSESSVKVKSLLTSRISALLTVSRALLVLSGVV